MRYIINDDDFEYWIKVLKELSEHLKEIDGNQRFELDYVICEMENELKQHKKVN